MTPIVKHFRTNSALRVGLLGLTVLVGFGIYFWSGSLVAAGLVGLGAFYQLVALIRYVEKTNRDLARLLQAIRYSDFTQGFSSGQRGESFAELSGAFKGVVDDFRDARREKEESYRYLQSVMQHIGIGLISFERDGKVSLINSAAKRILRLPYLKTMDRLEETTPRLVAAIKRLSNGDKTLVKIVRDGEALDLSVHATEFKIGGEHFKLVSIQNIRSELEDTEAAAWQMLARVLSHEIMNSVAPIASLAATVDGILTGINVKDEDTGEHLEDVKAAVSTIARRSEGLLHFVESYRRVTRVPDPERSRFRVSKLFDTVSTLMQARIEEAGVAFTMAVRPETIELDADREQVEQILINLLNNAQQAMADLPSSDRSIVVRVQANGGDAVTVIVDDTGPGIEVDRLEKVFESLYTTRAEGMGMGLAICQSIVNAHGGKIWAENRDTGGARIVFELPFAREDQ